MVLKQFQPPWLVRHVLTCPECGGKVEILPIWPWEKQPDKLRERQPHCCHSHDPDFFERIPVLTENNWKSKLALDEFDKEMYKRMESDPEKGKAIITVSEDFQKYGIFMLISSFKDIELKVVSLFLCLEPEDVFTQANLQKMLPISRSHISGVLKQLQIHGLVEFCRGNVKGRARGRQLVYWLSEGARKRLEQDLKEHDFFREATFQTVQPYADAYSMFDWRKDMLTKINTHVNNQNIR